MLESNLIIKSLINSKVFNISDTYSLIQVNKCVSGKILSHHKNLLLIKKIKKFEIIPCTFNEWVGVTDMKTQAHEYSQEFYSKFFAKPFDAITVKEIGLLNSFIWFNTNVRNSKQILNKCSKYYQIHPNGLIKQIPNLQNFVHGNGPFLNVHYCYSTEPKQDFIYISDDLYLNLYLDVDFDNSNIKSSIEPIEKIMKLIILKNNKLSFNQIIYSLDLFLEY